MKVRGDCECGTLFEKEPIVFEIFILFVIIGNQQLYRNCEKNG